MMSEKYIRKNRKSYSIVKGSKTYARLSDLDDAKFIRDFLVENDWNPYDISQILQKDEDYLVLAVYDGKLSVLARFREKPDQTIVDGLLKKHRRNPNNSKYGLNISRIENTFVITKQIAGDSYIFGMYDNLEDAQFVRNFLMDHDWNVNEFGEIEFDEDTNTFRAVLIIDDYVYVIDSSESEDIDLSRSYEQFLVKISKHKYGLADYPHLDRLKDRIGELEVELNVKASDDMWVFGEAVGDKDTLTDIVFTLSPFEKSVYDAIGDGATFEEIKRKLIRYRSGKFEDKIMRNLDELIRRDLIVKDGEYYRLC